MQKLSNILWVVVDSVRSYSGAGDSRDLLPIFEELSQSGTRYLNVQSSAPSTIMSTSAMMSGIDSIYHSLTYQGFDATQNNIDYISKSLKKKGYNVYFISFFPEGFHALPPLFGSLTSDKSSLAPPKTQFWTNREINEVLKELVERDLIKEPFFFYLNYNCRHDPETSYEVEKGIELVKENCDFSNTYLIINSDHGYPDPSRELQKQMTLAGHDIVMSEDNITVPLVINGPLFYKNLVRQRCSLLSISELINSISNGRPSESELFNIANSELDSHLDSIFFTWNRYPAQFGGLVAVAYQKWKLVYSLDNCSFDWFVVDSYIDANNHWQVVEKTIAAKDVTPKALDYIIKGLEKELDKVTNHFSEHLASKVKLHTDISNADIHLVSRFTPFYSNILKRLSCSLGAKYTENKLGDSGLSEFILHTRNLDSTINKVNHSFRLFIPSGVSPVNYIVDLYSILRLGYYPSIVCDYDLANPTTITDYFRKQMFAASRQLRKSITARGLKETGYIVMQKLILKR